MLRNVFEGVPVNILKVKNPEFSSSEKLEEMKDTLNQEFPHKSFHPVRTKNDEAYLVEKLHSRSVDFKQLHSKIENNIIPAISKVI